MECRHVDDTLLEQIPSGEFPWLRTRGLVDFLYSILQQ